jgi:hypothetical protein
MFVYLMFADLLFLNFDFSVTIISLRLSSLHMESTFTAEHVLSRIVSLSHAL